MKKLVKRSIQKYSQFYIALDKIITENKLNDRAYIYAAYSMNQLKISTFRDEINLVFRAIKELVNQFKLDLVINLISPEYSFPYYEILITVYD